jgi:hypothetical protein
MRNFVFGTIGVLWGAAIVLQGRPEADNAYGAGELASWVFGFLLIGAGAWALQREIRSRRTS